MVLTTTVLHPGARDESGWFSLFHG